MHGSSEKYGQSERRSIDVNDLGEWDKMVTLIRKAGPGAGRFSLSGLRVYTRSGERESFGSLESIKDTTPGPESLGISGSRLRIETLTLFQNTQAYGETLKPYHGWAIRPIFAVSYIRNSAHTDTLADYPTAIRLISLHHPLHQLAMKAVPYRSNFYRVLGEPVDDVMRELDEWLTGLERILSRMEDVYKKGGYGSIDGKP